MVQGLQPDVCGQYFYSGRAGSEVCRLWSEGSVVRGLWSKVYSPTSVASTSTLVARYLRSAVCGLRGLWSVVCPRFTTRRLCSSHSGSSGAQGGSPAKTWSSKQRPRPDTGTSDGMSLLSRTAWKAPPTTADGQARNARVWMVSSECWLQEVIPPPKWRNQTSFPFLVFVVAFLAFARPLLADVIHAHVADVLLRTGGDFRAYP